MAPNRLADETSPYLLQHADNPVDWYPWGPEALERARREDKPILLSIGYAACHWCHVMERESFEDPETAALMNERFVSIKVDREERPDVDAVYMEAAQSLSGGGGWPLTVFLTPEGMPFYAGTYFPDEDRHGLPAFGKVLTAIGDAWRDRRTEAESVAAQVVTAMDRGGQLRPSDDPLSDELARSAFAVLRRAFDARWGGFGGAPKFPQPMTLEFVLRRHLRGEPGALDMVTLTLGRMAAGGMYDQIGGGFHRYATDAQWHVPHFEKMLYDNAQLVRLYVHAWLVTREDRYRRVATQTCDYLLREMQHPEGGFFSSQDADSEGVEGRFFTWSWDELVDAGGEELTAAAGAMRDGNWEGTNVLRGPIPPVARERLFDIRETRERPATDDKVLAGWNGLAIAALAEAGRAFDVPEYVEAATRAAEFVLTHLRENGRLLRSWRNGRASIPAYAEDHALLADGCLTLYETAFDVRLFEAARALCDDLLARFRDPDLGGFFQTGSDAETLVVRPKDLQDNAIPSGNSAAADVLQRLAHLTGEPEYERAAVSALRVVREPMARFPTGFGLALSALDRSLGPAPEIAIVGDPLAPRTRALVAEVTRHRFVPNHVLAVAPASDAAAGAIELLRDRTQRDGVPTAYVCERFVCKLPVTEPNELAAQLET